MDVLVFGNRLIKEDAVSLKIMESFKKKFPEINFIEADPLEEIQKYGKRLKIIDAAAGIGSAKELVLNSLEDFDKIKNIKIYSMHDFDLGFNLKILKKLGLIDCVKIICLPYGSDEKKVFSHVHSILKKWVAQDMQGS